MSPQSIFTLFRNFITKFEVEESPPPLYTRNFLLLLGLAFLIVIPYSGLLSLLDVDQFDHKMEEMLEKYKSLIVVAAVIIAPLLEEIAFRYHLDGSKNKIWISFGVSLLFFSDYWWINSVLIGYFLLLLFTKYSTNFSISTKWMVIASSICFGLIHMGNFTSFNFLENFYWVPLLVGVQVVLGFLLSFLRLQYGTWHGIAFHAAYNGVAVAIALIGEAYFPDAF